MLQAFNRESCSELHFRKIDVTDGKEAAKRKEDARGRETK